MSNPRRRSRGMILVLALIVAAMFVVPWTPDTSSVDVTERDAPSEREAPTLQGHPPPEPGVDPSAVVPIVERPWWFISAVESLDPEITTAYVEARWWPDAPSDPNAEPEAVFRTEDLDLTKGPAAWRLEGNVETGRVLLFIIAGGRSEPYSPFVANPDYPVRPAGGFAPDTGLVGAYVFAGRAVDPDGEPVGDIELQVRGRENEFQRVKVNEQGYFNACGFTAPDVKVEYNSRGTWDYFPEIAGFKDREITLSKEKIELVMPRNPRVVIRGRVNGFGPQATCPPNTARSTLLLPGGEEQHRGRHWTLMHGIRLLPGKWRLEATFFPAPPIVIETGQLELDEEKTYTVDVDYGDKVAVVQVGFDSGPRLISDPVACAAEGRWLGGSRGWSGAQTAAASASVLLVLNPGPYEVTGAIRVAERVHFSVPRRVEVLGGDRERITLRTQPAGGIFIPRVPRHLDGVLFIELVERKFPKTGVVRDEPFAMAWLGNGRRDTTWWMPPGGYTIVRRNQLEKETSRLSVEVRAGKVTRLKEGPVGLLLAED